MGIRNYFKNRAENASRSTLVVSTNSWHGRLYHFWRNHSEFKNTRAYRENLCHYVRVILFWGPLSLFLRLSPKKYEWITPATVLLSLAAISGVVASFVLNPWGSLGVLAILVGTVAAVVAAAFSVWWIDDNKYEIRDWYYYEGRGSWIFRGPARALGAIGRALIYKIGGKVPVLAVLAVVAYITLSVTVTNFFWLTLALLGGFTIFAVLAVGIGMLAEVLKERASHKRVYRSVAVKEKDEGFFSVGGRFLAAKKGRICPFIEVVN